MSTSFHANLPYSRHGPSDGTADGTSGLGTESGVLRLRWRRGTRVRSFFFSCRHNAADLFRAEGEKNTAAWDRVGRLGVAPANVLEMVSRRFYPGSCPENDVADSVRFCVSHSKGLHRSVRAKLLINRGVVTKLLQILDEDPLQAQTQGDYFRISRLQRGLSSSTRYSEPSDVSDEFVAGPVHCRVSMGDGPPERWRRRVLTPVEAFLNSIQKACEIERAREQATFLAGALKKLNGQMTLIRNELKTSPGRPPESLDLEFWDCLYFAFSQSYSRQLKGAASACARGINRSRRIFVQIMYAYLQYNENEPDLGEPARKVVRARALRVLRLATPCLRAFHTTNAELQRSKNKRVREYVDGARSATALGPREAANYVFAKLYQISRETVVLAERARPPRLGVVISAEAGAKYLDRVRRPVFPLWEELEQTCDRLGWVRMAEHLRTTRMNCELIASPTLDGASLNLKSVPAGTRTRGLPKAKLG